MKIWLSKNSEVPIREQLVAQIELAIASGEYPVGRKLPSTRELARRFSIHSNTVSSVYRQLVDQNLIEFRQGSGYYVTEFASDTIETSHQLDRLIRNLFDAAADLGFDRSDVLERLRKRPSSSRSKHLVVVEPDPSLREILLHELSAAFPAAVSVSSRDRLPSGLSQKNVLYAAMFDEKPKLDPVLGNDHRCVYLRGRSVAAAMSTETRPSDDDIIAVVSGWDGFLNFARIMLIAAKIEPGRLVIRSTSDDDWRHAAEKAAIVICDLVTARKLGDRPGIRPFRIVADESLEDIASHLNGSPLS